MRKVLDGDVDRLSVFGAFLDRLASEPSLALIEDLHRADEATHDFLRFIARRSFARAA